MKRHDPCARHSRPRRNPRITIACWLLSGMAANAAWADAASTSAEFNLPAQPLSSSLNSMAVQANVQMLFEPGSVAGIQAPALTGAMTVEQALKRLLVNTNLEYLENDNGTIVVRPKAPLPTARRQARPAAPVAPAAPAASAPETEGPWTLRARGGYRENMHDELVADDGWTAELALERRLHTNLSAELSFGFPREHALGQTTGVPGSTATPLGDFRMSSHFLTFKYNFLPERNLQPYLGFGLNYSDLHRQDPGAVSLGRDNWAPAAQAGFDVQLGKHWLLNADIKYARVRPDVGLSSVPAGNYRMDPVTFAFGFGYRFGEVAAPVVITPPPPAPLPPPAPVAPPPVVRGLPPPPPPPPADTDRDGVADPSDKCPGTLAGLKVDADGCEIEEVVLTGVSFETNSATLTTQSAAVLDTVVAALRQRSNATAELHGYTDDRGSETYNLRLSGRRAAAVVDYLKQHGIAATNLSAHGHGEASPIATNSTEAGRASNRRVTIRFSRVVAK
jgi:outer membrane protein OmpA-like peptidoglycan-associated protein/outer membrane protein W